MLGSYSRKTRAAYYHGLHLAGQISRKNMSIITFSRHLEIVFIDSVMFIIGVMCNTLSGKERLCITLCTRHYHCALSNLLGQSLAVCTRVHVYLASRIDSLKAR